MGLFNLSQPDINQGIKDYKNTPDAILLDVRSRQEYADGHIPGSRNTPLPELPKLAGDIGAKDTPLFVYCLSGGRSQRAVAFLKKVGYTNVNNIGGINNYHGTVEK